MLFGFVVGSFCGLIYGRCAADPGGIVGCGPDSVLTFRQLDALIGGREISAANLEVVKHALNEAGVEVIDAEAEWPRRPASL